MKNRVCLKSCTDHHYLLPKRQAPSPKSLINIDLFSQPVRVFSSRLSGNVTALYRTLFRTIVEILLKCKRQAFAYTIPTQSSLITQQGHHRGEAIH